MEEFHRQFVVQFLAEIMQVTGTTDDQDTFQTSLQSYVDSLRPWLEPSDGLLIPVRCSPFWRAARLTIPVRTSPWSYPRKPKPSFAPGCGATRSRKPQDSILPTPGRTDAEQSSGAGGGAGE